MNDPPNPNPIRKWMRDARKEFGSAEEMKVALVTVANENTRGLLEREAQEWALEELRFTPEGSGVRRVAHARVGDGVRSKKPGA